MAKKLWEICRDAKDAAHVTNQHIADETGLALNTVSQYLRGDTKHPSVYTVGPICRACSVDLNAYFNIKYRAKRTQKIAALARNWRTQSRCSGSMNAGFTRVP